MRVIKIHFARLKAKKIILKYKFASIFFNYLKMRQR